MKVIAKFVLAAALLAVAPLALSQSDYPNRTVRVIVPFAPGGATDVLARLLAQFMEKRFGQSFIIENRPGGITQIGTQVVVNSPPDGYTLLVQSSSVSSEEATDKDWTVRIERDLTPISMFAGSGFAVTVSTAIQVKTLSELVAYSRANPGKINEAAAGAISPDIAILKYRLKMGATENIMYKGGPLAVQSVVAGDTQLYGAAVLDVVQLDKDGKVKVLAYTGRERHPLLPNVPTVAESGVGINDYEAGFYFALMGPAKLPQDIVNKLNAASLDAVKSPELLAKLTTFGMTAYSNSPAQAKDRMMREIKAYQDAMAAGVKLR